MKLKVYTPREARALMIQHAVDPSEIAESLEISERQAYRSISLEKTPSLRELAAVTLCLDQIIKSKQNVQNESGR